MSSFSIQTISAIVEVVTGGAGNSSSKSIGIYRSGPKLEIFLGAAGIELHIGDNSRVPSVRNVVLQANEENPDSVVKLIEQVADPREYSKCKEKLLAVVEYLNTFLIVDGYELRQLRGRYKLFPIESVSVLTNTLSDKAKELSFESVSDDFNRAITQANQDPEGAITSACSTLESVCKCILDEMGKPYPSQQDISGMVKAVEKELNLSPSREDIEPDIKQILGGLANVSRGIGTLRTHSGDAHGRGKQSNRVDTRIARLAIHAASTVALFFIETWEKQKG